MTVHPNFPTQSVEHRVGRSSCSTEARPRSKEGKLQREQRTLMENASLKRMYDDTLIVGLVLLKDWRR